MARLSVAHFKSNPGTPQPERKTNRFREMFKNRPSSSASSSPNLLTKMQHASSPIVSPTVKPGFEKIGILPSERSSFETARRVLDRSGKSTLSEMLSDDMRKFNSEHSAGMATTAAAHETPIKIQAPDQEIKKEATEKLSLPVPGTAIHNAMEIDSSPPAPLSRSFTKDSIEPEFALFKRFCQAAVPPLDLSASAHGKSKGSVLFLAVTDASDIATEDPFHSCDDHDSHRKSLASNIFDDDDSLSQGIREYVASKIAKAISEHEVRLAREKQGVFNMHMQSSSKVAFPMSAFKVIKNAFGCDGAPVNLWTSSRSIGPFTINHTRAANLLQYATNSFIAITVLGAAFSGPKDLFLALWRWAIILGFYAATVKHLGWGDHVGQDLLLAPIIYGGQEIQVWGKKMTGDFIEPARSTLAPLIKSSE